MSDTTEIEHALDVLLRAVVQHEATKPPYTGPLRATSFKWHGDAPIPTREECQLASILRDPVRGALDLAIRCLGERLFELVGTIGGMQDVAERVADLDAPRYGYRATILDHRWDGIGSGNDMWWA